MRQVKKMEADIVIAGGGPGGCVLAKDLTKKGKKVILVEQGGNDMKFFGNLLSPMFGGHVEQGRGLSFMGLKTIEGDALIQGIGVGGGTKLYVGFAFKPDEDAWRDVGIDLAPYLDEAMKESWVQEVPDEFYGPVHRRLTEAAHSLGYPWAKFTKHINYDRCDPRCTKCFLGCTRDAKWGGQYPANEAVKEGATILTHTKIRDVITENGVAIGIRGQDRRGQRYEILGNVVVLAAGGIGTARILQRSGVYEAGSLLAGDPSLMMCGFLDEGQGHYNEHPMVNGHMDDERGCLIAGGFPAPRPIWFGTFLQHEGFGKMLRRVGRYRSAVGAWTKTHDEGLGRVGLDGSTSKVFTSADKSKLDYARSVIERILIKVGCDPYNILQGKIIIGHPSGTAPVGKVVDSNLQTPIKNLYCCDTSVSPGAPGRPPTLTIVCLAKRLAPHLQTIV
ncbi:GMC family oxidoreductase N-terminal domain-containing protein [Chloroflexota bacterium]